jgi:putative transposase
MPRKGHTEEQILQALRQERRPRSSAGSWGSANRPLYLEAKVFWDRTERAAELRQLRDENAKLKKLVADLSLDRHMLQEIVRKKL